MTLSRLTENQISRGMEKLSRALDYIADTPETDNAAIDILCSCQNALSKETPRQPLEEFLLGGPGHDGYVYNADVYCVDCGQEIIRDIYSTDYDKLESQDSEDSPQPIFFGESPDCEQHCGNCGEYMYGESDKEEVKEIRKGIRKLGSK